MYSADKDTCLVAILNNSDIHCLTFSSAQGLPTRYLPILSIGMAKSMFLLDVPQYIRIRNPMWCRCVVTNISVGPSFLHIPNPKQPRANIPDSAPMKSHFVTSKTRKWWEVYVLVLLCKQANSGKASVEQSTSGISSLFIHMTGRPTCACSPPDWQIGRRLFAGGRIQVCLAARIHAFQTGDTCFSARDLQSPCDVQNTRTPTCTSICSFRAQLQSTSWAITTIPLTWYFLF